MSKTEESSSYETFLYLV